MKPPVFVSIVEHIADFFTHDEYVALINCCIAAVKHAVYVLPQQNAVRNAVRASLTERPDVGGIKCRQNFAIRQGALSAISLRYRNPKCSLAKSGCHQHRLPEPRSCVIESRLNAWVPNSSAIHKL